MGEPKIPQKPQGPIKKEVIKTPEGVEEYYEEGILFSKRLPDKTIEYYDLDGKMFSKKLSNGVREDYDGNGKIMFEEFPDGSRKWYVIEPMAKQEEFPIIPPPELMPDEEGTRITAETPHIIEVPEIKLEGPFSADQMREMAREKEKAQAIARLRETIENALRVIEEEERKIEIREKRLAEIREEKEREKADKPRKEALEKDREQNPFKYFILEKMSAEAIWCLFMKEKEKITLEDINHYYGDSNEVGFFTPNFIKETISNTIEMSNNGFTLQLQNVNDVKNEKGIKVDDPMARYKLVSPNWEHRADEIALSYEEGMRLLGKRAREYQTQLIAEFEAKK